MHIYIILAPNLQIDAKSRDWVKNGTVIFKYWKNDAISFYITNIGLVGWNNVYRTSTNEFYLYFCMHNHEIEHFVRCYNVTDFDFDSVCRYEIVKNLVSILISLVKIAKKLLLKYSLTI